MASLVRFCKVVAFSGVLFSGGCLADNFWSTLLGDTFITGAAGLVVEAVVGGALPQ